MSKISGVFSLKYYLKLSFGKIRFSEYLNCNENPQYDILILPGANDFIEIFENFSTNLCVKNSRVIVIDHPGQGLSTRFGKSKLIRHVDSYDYYFESIEKIINYKKLGKNRPLIFIGHSLGAFLSISYLFKKELLNNDLPTIKPSKIVAITPMMSLNVYIIDQIFVKIITFFLKLFKISNIGFPRKVIKLLIFLKITHRDVINNISLSSGAWRRKENIDYYGINEAEKMLNIYKKYPDLEIAGPSWHWTDLTLKICKNLFKKKLIRKVNIPVLVFYSENEKVVNPNGIEKFIKYLKNKKSILLKNSTHSVFNEKKEIQNYLLDNIYGFIFK